jgi:hypothetical protein
MKKTIAVMMLLGGGLFAAPQIRVGIGFGAPAPIEVARPACPGPGYTWVDGYYANGGSTAGYWAPPAVVRQPVEVRDNVVRSYDRDHSFRGRDVHFDRDHGRR